MLTNLPARNVKGSGGTFALGLLSYPNSMRQFHILQVTDTGFERHPKMVQSRKNGTQAKPTKIYVCMARVVG